MFCWMHVRKSLKQMFDKQPHSNFVLCFIHLIKSWSFFALIYIILFSRLFYFSLLDRCELQNALAYTDLSYTLLLCTRL